MRFLLIPAILLSFTVTATAEPYCFRAEEIEADQAVQFQNELMVLSDTCKTQSYINFLMRNRVSIISYQHALIAHFHRAGARDGQDALDRYMTQIANQKSLQYAERERDALCAASAGFLATGDRIAGPEFRKIAATRATDMREAYRRCK